MNHVLKDERERGWFHLDNAIIDEYLPKIGVTAFAVYACIVRHSNAQGEAFPSYSKLQSELGCGRSQVAAAIKRIVDAGLVTITTGKRASNCYHVVTVSTSPKAELVPIRNQSQPVTSPAAEPELVPNRDSNKTQLRTNTPGVLRTPAPTPKHDSDFESWWLACPPRMRRCGKSETAGVWKNLNGSRPPLAAMLGTLSRQIESHDWTKDGGQYVPMATTYLRKRRWEADVGGMDIEAADGTEAVTGAERNMARSLASIDQVLAMKERMDHGQPVLSTGNGGTRRSLSARSGIDAGDDGGMAQISRPSGRARISEEG